MTLRELSSRENRHTSEHRVLTLRQKQSLFVRLIARLIIEVDRRGYELTFGECWRPPETAALYARQGRGNKRSLHSLRLAFDLNLFKNGVYLRTTAAHQPLGEWWEQQHELCRWGGRFADGNHYSLKHGNMK